ncbi:MAG: cyclic pyranopterin monophosphate synthase MoaC [Bacteroidales bacterium]|nr:cyclic pyranopterin monophosphate synthase MoaC [Bacteroidales bacterium]
MKLTHINNDGKAQMVNICEKEVVYRKAIAEGTIYINPNTIEQIKNNCIKKGDVLCVAKIAGIQAAKQTANLIPLTHPLNINFIDINFKIYKNKIKVLAEVECIERTGVEMEALCAVSVTLLTIYDMCKSSDRKMRISEIKLLKKEKRKL